MSFRTEQEAFWAGEFGDAYVERSTLTDAFVAARTAAMSRMLARCQPLGSAFEAGCNLGVNLVALNRLSPGTALSAVEINETAARKAGELGLADVTCGSFLEFETEARFDLTLISGVLIHLAPEALETAYDKLFALSRRYVLLFEYYNPTPVEVSYRGHSGRLFKRDFAGEMLDRFEGRLELLDYGFFYRRDPIAWSDDGTWFLLEKR